MTSLSLQEINLSSTILPNLVPSVCPCLDLANAREGDKVVLVATDDELIALDYDPINKTWVVCGHLVIDNTNVHLTYNDQTYDHVAINTYVLVDKNPIISLVEIYESFGASVSIDGCVCISRDDVSSHSPIQRV